MTPELQNKLFNDFPLLYDKSYENRSSNGFTFECSDGWYQLILELSEKIYPHVKNWKAEEGEFGPSVTQVKEKYGTLRYYMSFTTKEIDDLIDEYEAISERTCELCGNVGEIDYKRNWLRVLCETCRSA